MSHLNVYIYDDLKPRAWETLGYTSEMHRSRYRIKCPFCGDTFYAFLSSMAACGKKCPQCGAIHFRDGTAYPMREKRQISPREQRVKMRYGHRMLIDGKVVHEDDTDVDDIGLIIQWVCLGIDANGKVVGHPSLAGNLYDGEHTAEERSGGTTTRWDPTQLYFMQNFMPQPRRMTDDEFVACQNWLVKHNYAADIDFAHFHREDD